MLEDPWDSFGAEYSDDESINNDNDHDEACEKERARLISETNSRLQSNTHTDSRYEVKVELFTEESVHRNNPCEFTSVDTWPNRRPMYMGPIRAVCMNDTSSPNNACSRIGGNRGYVATENIEPGTLLLVEEAVFTWPYEQIGSELGMCSILSILTSERAQDIVEDMEQLHPTKVAIQNCLGKKKKLTLKKDEEDQIFLMVQETKIKREDIDNALIIARERNITTKATDMKNVRNLDELDIIRMLLALRYNGFMSGLYLFFSIFNHDEQPNCIKYMPEKNRKDITSDRPDHENCHRSEIRTIKRVARGEPLTLSYLHPREVSHATRRWHLWDQHRFDIGSDNIRSEEIRMMELVNGELPISSAVRRQKDQTFFVENSLLELEEACDDFESRLRGNNSADVLEAIEGLKSLEMASSELIQASVSKLQNENHLLLIRCCRLHLNSAELLLQRDSDLNKKQKVAILCKFLSTTQRLLPLQLQYLGSNHPDLARTYMDKAMAINTLLSTAPKLLFAMKLPKLSNIHSCSKEENYCWIEHNRVKAMYPHDVEEKVKKYQVGAKV